MKLRLIFILSIVVLLALGCDKAVNTTAQTPLTSVNSTIPTTPPPATDVFMDATKKISLNYTNLSVQLTAPGSYIPAQNTFTNGKELTVLYVKPALYSGTNLESAWFELATDSKLDKVSCFIDNSKTPPGNYNKTRTVQGNSWYYELPNPHGDGAAGHQELVETYRLYKNNLCYEVDLGASSFSRQNLENPNTVKEFDSVRIFYLLGAVFNNLEVK